MSEENGALMQKYIEIGPFDQKIRELTDGHRWSQTVRTGHIWHGTEAS